MIDTDNHIRLSKLVVILELAEMDACKRIIVCWSTECNAGIVTPVADVSWFQWKLNFRALWGLWTERNRNTSILLRQTKTALPCADRLNSKRVKLASICIFFRLRPQSSVSCSQIKRLTDLQIAPTCWFQSKSRDTCENVEGYGTQTSALFLYTTLPLQLGWSWYLQQSRIAKASGWDTCITASPARISSSRTNGRLCTPPFWICTCRSAK